ncbi:MAG TPA: hypothetical protein DEP69_05480, partial [Acidimicrobiaceae bacterium]|nr:hypothetical protein [Acidimicrobiaceae bacterium]
MDFTPATSRPSRRLRRRLAVASAALLLASAPAFVAASSAGAANTAAESLDDHDDDKTTPGVRLISGSNRYATAIAAANAYVDNVSATGFVDTAIVVSGESIVDALAVAGLSAAKTAPILLTQSNRLPSAVASFLDDQFIAEVLVVGGTDAVSERVFEALEDVPSVDTVTRISGEDRYATAAAVADEIGADSEYCDTGQVGAVLVNGNSFVDAVSVAPLAYALQIPVLLTQAGELSSDAAGFLVDEEIEHVAIIGGTAAISEAVEEEVKSIVVGTTRIAGANR